VLHDPNMAARHCDKLIALKNGNLLTQGTPHEIMKDDMLKRIFGVEMRVFSHPMRGHPISYLQ
jgi:ferric hydroxamate transport system ATP-binding protein